MTNYTEGPWYTSRIPRGIHTDEGFEIRDIPDQREANALLLTTLTKVKAFMEECCDLRIGFRGWEEYKEVCDAIKLVEMK